MQIKFLKEIVGEIAGKPAMEIVDSLVGKRDINEFLIAKKLKLTINQTRNILYKLSNYRLVSFTRKKDKRKGWYIYFWTLDSLKSLELLEKKLLDELAHLEKQSKSRKMKRFYFCKICNTEVGEETALLNNFVCPECGQVYELAKKEKVVKELENSLNKLKKDLEAIKAEIEILREKERKKLKKKEAEKEKKKGKKAKARKKAKAKKVAKKAKAKAKKGKKPVSKKKAKAKKVIKKIKKAVKKKAKKAGKKTAKKIKKKVKKVKKKGKKK
jgi:transcription factor E